MEVRVAAYSQTNRLRERMTEADVGHGQEVRIDVRNVRVQVAGRTWLDRREQVMGHVFFCAVGRVDVRRVVIEGDGRPLPEATILDGLRVPCEGSYDLLNVLVRSNGKLRLIVDEASRVERSGVEVVAIRAGN
jgi:hypothetical protein